MILKQFGLQIGSEVEILDSNNHGNLPDNDVHAGAKIVFVSFSGTTLCLNFDPVGFGM